MTTLLKIEKVEGKHTLKFLKRPGSFYTGLPPVRCQFWSRVGRFGICTNKLKMV